MSRTNLTTLLVAMAFVAGITIGSVGLWTQVVRGSPYSSPSAFELGPVPVGMNFQGEVTDLSGTGLNGKYNMRFAIFDSLTGGTNAWPGAVASFEQHDEIDVADGLFNTILGGRTAPIPHTVFASRQGQFVQMWVCKTSGASCTDYDELGPRQVITSVAYAMMSGAAAGLVGPQSLTTSNTISLDVETDKVGDLSMAIRGTASASSKQTIGVKGSSNSEDAGAIGVWGQAGGQNGAGFGVLGQVFSNSTESVGVRGTATKGSAISGSSTDGWGVEGVSETSNGGTFITRATDSAAAAVMAVSSNATSETTGVSGQVISSDSSSTGVKGSATGGVGVRGTSQSSFGGVFETDHSSAFLAGLIGKGKTGASKGVVGQSSGTSNDAAGVYGQALGETGANAGVLGENSSDSDGAAGVSGF